MSLSYRGNKFVLRRREKEMLPYSSRSFEPLFQSDFIKEKRKEKKRKREKRKEERNKRERERERERETKRSNW